MRLRASYWGTYCWRGFSVKLSGVVGWYGMTTSPLYRDGLSWKATSKVLDSICSALDLKWSWDPTRYLIVFQMSRPGDQTAHDLETCFGDPDPLEFRATKGVITRMPEDEIRVMLETWVRGKLSMEEMWG